MVKTYTESTGWEMFMETETKSLDAIKKRLAQMRKANPKWEFKASKIVGPRGGVTYIVEGRKKKA